MAQENVITTKEDVTAEMNAISPQSIHADVKSEFCKLWPTAKTVLELLEKVVPRLKFVIELVITAGDKLAEKICRA